MPSSIRAYIRKEHERDAYTITELNDDTPLNEDVNSARRSAAQVVVDNGGCPIVAFLTAFYRHCRSHGRQLTTLSRQRERTSFCDG